MAVRRVAGISQPDDGPDSLGGRKRARFRAGERRAGNVTNDVTDNVGINVENNVEIARGQSRTVRRNGWMGKSLMLDAGDSA
jgi:hypothetical protein